MAQILQNKKILISFGILGVIFFAVIYLLFYSQEGTYTGTQGAAVRNTGPSSSEHIIEVRESGFYPQDIIINRGGTVKFTATRNKPFWPASNLHPVHAIYPAFDAREPVGPGEDWAFTFDKAGEWKYHDHLNSSLLGTITVMDKAEVEDYDLDCGNLDNVNPQRKKACYRNLLEDAFEKGGASEAFEMLVNLYKTEPQYIVAGCHKQAHEIGDLTYGEYLKHKDLDQVEMPPEAQTFCGAGFYHGFLEHYMRDNPGVESSREFCEYLEKRKPGIRGTCYHGMGHGMTPDPPDPATWGSAQAILDPVLGKCDNISDDTNEVLECHEGAFNVILDWMDIGQYGLAFDKNDHFEICRKQPTREREHACYYEFGMRVHSWADNDIEKVAELFIDEIEDDYMAHIAIGSAVATVIEASLDNKDFTEYMLACRNLKERLRESCTTNVIYGVIYHGEPGKEYIRALELCGSSYLSHNEKEICYGKISIYAAPYWPEKKEEICASFEEEYRELC